MYRVIILPKAIDDLSRLDKAITLRIIDKLAWLSENFESIPPLPLGADYAGFHKLRVGDWRVIYDIDLRQAGYYGPQSWASARYLYVK